MPDYREHVLETIYAGASIDYAPVRRSWFVLSGTRDDTVFYERVSFTCGEQAHHQFGNALPVRSVPLLQSYPRKDRANVHPSRAAETGC